MDFNDWFNAIAIPVGFVMWISCIGIMYRAVIVKKRTDFNLDSPLMTFCALIGSILFWYLLPCALLDHFFNWSEWPKLINIITGIALMAVTVVFFGMLPLSYFTTKQKALRNSNE